MSLIIELTGAPAISAGTIGSVDNVLMGTVPEALRRSRFDAERIQCGFESGSPGSFLSLGETIAFNGVCYTSRTDRREVQNRLLWGRDFVTSGFFFIPKGSRPAAVCTIDSTMSMEMLYSELLKNLKAPFAIAGTASFSELSLTALSAPPIHGEAIFDHKDRYFKEAVLTLQDTAVALMGLATDFREKAFKGTNDTLNTVLYHNPFGDTKDIASHTHVLVTKRHSLNLDDVRPDDAVDVYHLLPASQIAYAKLSIFTLTHATDLSEQAKTL